MQPSAATQPIYYQVIDTVALCLTQANDSVQSEAIARLNPGPSTRVKVLRLAENPYADSELPVERL